jgi:hypothetical protein
VLNALDHGLVGLVDPKPIRNQLGACGPLKVKLPHFDGLLGAARRVTHGNARAVALAVFLILENQKPLYLIKALK